MTRKFYTAPDNLEQGHTAKSGKDGFTLKVHNPDFHKPIAECEKLNKQNSTRPLREIFVTFPKYYNN